MATSSHFLSRNSQSVEPSFAASPGGLTSSNEFCFPTFNAVHHSEIAFTYSEADLAQVIKAIPRTESSNATTGSIAPGARKTAHSIHKRGKR
jgi:hypothetical protein